MRVRPAGRWPTAVLAALLAVVGAGSLPVAGEAAAPTPVILPPGDGCRYHGVYPGGVTGYEDDIRPRDVDAYEAATGHRVAWVYLSDNWFHGRAFPTVTARWIRERGSVPFIRLMLRSGADGPREPRYTLRRIIRGDFDADLRAWGRAARAFGTPLLVEYGTEMNGRWFSWNGTHNGGPGIGPRGSGT